MSSVLSKLDTGENNRTEGGPGCALGLHKLRISLPSRYYFLPCKWWGGRGGDEKKNGKGEWGVVETWVKNAKPEHCYLVFIPLEHWQYSCDSQALKIRVAKGWRCEPWPRLELRMVQTELAQETRVIWSLHCHHSAQRGWLGHSLSPCLSNHMRRTCLPLKDPLRTDYMWGPWRTQKPPCSLVLEGHVAKHLELRLPGRLVSAMYGSVTRENYKCESELKWTD